MPVSDSSPFCVMLFRTVSCVMKAESILIERKVPHKIVPVPREISSDCGVCLKCVPRYQESIEAALAGNVEIQKIRMIMR